MELSVRLLKSSCFKLRQMTGSFRRAHFSMVQQKASKNEILNQIGVNVN